MLELGLLQVVGLTVVVVAVAVWRRHNKPVTLESFLLPTPPPDTVILHQYGPVAPSVPSISPFVMKLETYLRVANIPYQNQYDRRAGPKGKLPWIQYNQNAVPDSQGCIEFLNSTLDLDLNKKLRPQQLALGHLARRTCEESLYWVLLMFRLAFDKDGVVYRKLSLPRPIIWYMRRSALPRLWSQGIGRHSEEEVSKMLEDDLSALSDLLGSSRFLFGEERDSVTEFDCAVFGQLCQLVWQMPGSKVESFIADKFPNLVAFCENMRDEFWPDWDERLINHSGKAKENKD